MSETAIRHARAEDLPALTRIYNHYVRETPVTFDLEPLDPADRGEWFAQFGTSGPHQLLVAQMGATLVGYAYSHRFRERRAYDSSAETSIYLAADVTGAGLGTRLYTDLLRRLEDTDLHRAFAGITLPNEASVALHRRCGFDEVGVFREAGHKFGQYWDVVWFQRSL